MKKMVNTSFLYAIAAMVGGVFYREFTKFTGFIGKTPLSVVHTHLFLLGMVFTLVAMLVVDKLNLYDSKKLRIFNISYNIGVPFTAIMLFVRGVLVVLGTPLSSGLNAAISGISGIGHIFTGVGIIFFFLAVKENLAKSSK